MQLTAFSDEQILAVVNPLMDNLMDGSREVDHAKHTRDFTERMKEIVTAERLEEMCKDYQGRIGFFEHRDVVGVFRRKNSVAVVWRQWSSKPEDEYVAEIIVIEKDGRYLVNHAMIF